MEATDPIAVLAVLTTVDSAEAAEALARGAVGARLAACAQISAPVTSVYHWQGAVETAQEWQILFKTAQDRYPALEAHLLAAHGYENPEIIATPVVRGSAAYREWVAAETRAAGTGAVETGAGTGTAEAGAEIRSEGSAPVDAAAGSADRPAGRAGEGEA